jgi:hypothetical protein
MQDRPWEWESPERTASESNLADVGELAGEGPPAPVECDTRRISAGSLNVRRTTSDGVVVGRRRRPLPYLRLDRRSAAGGFVAVVATMLLSAAAVSAVAAGGQHPPRRSSADQGSKTGCRRPAGRRHRKQHTRSKPARTGKCSHPIGATGVIRLGSLRGGAEDTSVGVHVGLPAVDGVGGCCGSLLSASPPVREVFDWNAGNPSAYPCPGSSCIYKGIYFPADRQADTRYNAGTQPLSWFYAKHPDWVELADPKTRGRATARPRAAAGARACRTRICGSRRRCGASTGGRRDEFPPAQGPTSRAVVRHPRRSDGVEVPRGDHRRHKHPGGGARRVDALARTVRAATAGQRVLQLQPCDGVLQRFARLVTARLVGSRTPTPVRFAPSGWARREQRAPRRELSVPLYAELLIAEARRPMRDQRQSSAPLIISKAAIARTCSSAF